MKKIVIIALLFTCVQTSLCSQSITWASKVFGFSSQKSFPEFSANQALGKPSVMPRFGLTECAWQPKIPTQRIEWIRLEFEDKIYASRIFINEPINPGAISRVLLFDSLMNGHQVYGNNNVDHSVKKGKLTTIDFPLTDYRVYGVKIEINVINFPDYYQIDAVGITGDKIDYDVTVNTPADTSDYPKENLGPNVNTQYSELAPVISSDGKTLYFTREYDPQNIGFLKLQDVWYSKQDSSGHFQPAINIGSPINNEYVNFAIAVSTDGNTLYLGNKYLPNGFVTNGFSMSKFNGSTWSFPDSLHIDNYYNQKESGSFSFTSDGKAMLLAIKRSGGYGSSDIHVCFRKPDGTWTEPKNLGSQINSAAEEVSPFLASDGVTLYYSSSGFPGYGEQDMFVSKRLDSTWEHWSEPVNLGPKINTSEWDAYYTLSAKGDYAYFVSSDNSIGKEDIFRVTLPKEVKPEITLLISGKVLNSKTKEPIAANIEYEILPEGHEAGLARSNELTGDYRIALPAGKKYGFRASASGFASVNEYLDLRDSAKYSELVRDLYLVPLEKGQVVRINNIFFDFGEYNLLNDSFSELNRLVDLLNQNPSMKIEIDGHTDDIGSNEDNLELSRKRAESVLNYLVEHNINRTRLTMKGLGESMPITTNKTEEGRSRNRRVEFKIIEK